MERLLFQQEQRFTQWWLWLIVIISTLVSAIPLLFGIYSQEVLGKHWGNNPASTFVLVLFLLVEIVVMGGVILLLFIMRLKTEIKSNCICYKYFPLMKTWNCITKGDIEKFEIRNYKPIAENGSWGIKGALLKKSYTVSGNIGLQLYLKNGKKILIGTQQKQGIEYAMEKMMKRENSTKNG